MKRTTTHLSICLVLIIAIFQYSCNIQESQKLRSTDQIESDNKQKLVIEPLAAETEKNIDDSKPAADENISPVTNEETLKKSDVVEVTDKHIKTVCVSSEVKSCDYTPITFTHDLGTISTSPTLTAPTGTYAPAKISHYTEDIAAKPRYTESSDGKDFEYKEPTPVTVPGAGASSASGVINTSLAGQLTAGEINDFQKWEMWQDIATDELKAYQEIWKINPSERFTVIVKNQKGSPIVDAEVILLSKSNETIWTSRTDNTGKAELWRTFDQSKPEKKQDQIIVNYRNQTEKIDRPKSIRNGVNSVTLRTDCDVPNTFDLLFTVDATGSMGDEISYLQAELVDVVNKVKSNHKDILLRLGSVFYRDHGDTYLTNISNLSENISVTNNFIANQYADGGGDGPEAVDDTLEVSVNEIKWSSNARARLMFLILDAPPHSEDQFLTKLKKSIEEASRKGIRIIPLVASGGGYDIDKSLEYLMRCCALATNGTYAFLTDHSGIGDAHTAPTTDKYDVETLNSLLVRIISQFLFVPACDVDEFIAETQPQDTAIIQQPYTLQADSTSQDSTATDIPLPEENIFILKCYPNPATDYIWAETSEQVTELFIADNSGKIIEKISPTSTLTRVDLTGYPTGIYYLKAWIDNKWASAKIIVTHI